MNPVVVRFADGLPDAWPPDAIILAAAPYLFEILRDFARGDKSPAMAWVEVTTLLYGTAKLYYRPSGERERDSLLVVCDATLNPPLLVGEHRIRAQIVIELASIRFAMRYTFGWPSAVDALAQLDDRAFVLHVERQPLRA